MAVNLEMEINNRVANLQRVLKEREVDAALLIDRTNVFYFANTGQQCHLFIPSDGKPLLIVKKTYDKAQKESPIENIDKMSSLKEIPALLEKYELKIGKRIGMELDVLPVNNYMSYKNMFTHSELLDISSIIRDIRMIKSDYEISLIKKSGELHQELFKYMQTFLADGMTDREIAGAVEGYARKIGHLGHCRFRGFNVEFYFGHTLVGISGAEAGPYDVMAAVGEGTAATFPQGVSGAVLERGVPVCADYVGNYTGYLVDQTRVFATGKLPDILEKAVAASIEIQSMAEEKIKDGCNGRDIYDEGVKIAEKAGLAKNYMGYPKGVPFIGHGIGLEINEWPVIAKNFDIELKNGMVIALEPKFTFPNLGIVGVENTFLVTATGTEKLTIGNDFITYV